MGQVQAGGSDQALRERSEEHTSELQSPCNLVCRLLLEKKQLVGAMQTVEADQGLLVCWGGFKPTIKRELPRLFFKVRLWDQNNLIDEFLTNYDKLNEDL